MRSCFGLISRNFPSRSRRIPASHSSSIAQELPKGDECPLQRSQRRKTLQRLVPARALDHHQDDVLEGAHRASGHKPGVLRPPHALTPLRLDVSEALRGAPSQSQL